MIDWGAIFGNAAVELISPTTAAYALAALGLAIHFGFTGLLNFGQAGFMLLGAYGYAIPALKLGWPVWACRAHGTRSIGDLRTDPRYPDAAPASRLPRDRDDRRGRGAAARLHDERVRRRSRVRRTACSGTRPACSRSTRSRPARYGFGPFVFDNRVWFFLVIALDRRGDRRGLHVAHHAQPVGSRHQGHPRRRGRRALARQERLLVQDAEPHPRWPLRHPGRHSLRPATCGRAVVLPAVADVLRLRDPAARRGRHHPRADRRLDRLLGAALLLLGLHRPSGRGGLASRS